MKQSKTFMAIALSFALVVSQTAPIAAFDDVSPQREVVGQGEASGQIASGIAGAGLGGLGIGLGILGIIAIVAIIQAVGNNGIDPGLNPDPPNPPPPTVTPPATTTSTTTSSSA